MKTHLLPGNCSPHLTVLSQSITECSTNQTTPSTDMRAASPRHQLKSFFYLIFLLFTNGAMAYIRHDLLGGCLAVVVFCSQSFIFAMTCCLKFFITALVCNQNMSQENDEFLTHNSTCELSFHVINVTKKLFAFSNHWTYLKQITTDVTREFQIFE